MGEYRGRPEHFYKYLKAKFREHKKTELYRIYMTDAMKALVESLGGKAEARYRNMISEEKAETRTAEEIVSHISDKLDRFGEVQ